MATTTFTTMIPTPQPKKAGPPVPPRPQQSSLLKQQQQQQRDVSSSSSSNATAATSQRLMSKVGLEQPQILKKPIIINANSSNSNSNAATVSLNSTSVTTSGGRTVIYKSPSLNLQKRQEDREKRNEASTQTATTAITRTTSAAATITTAKAKLTNGTQAPKPPLKLRKAPDVPTNFKPRITTPEVEKTETKSSDNLNQNANSNNNSNNGNNIVIVQSSQGVVTLNRHHSMGAGSPQNKPLAKDTRLSLGKVDFERVGKIQVQQLQPTTQPLPKPRKIVKVPVATLDVEDTSSSTTTSSSSSNTLHVNSLFKRSKTSIENFTSRSNITTVNTSGTGSYLSGKTVEIKNNLKNAAERLFSEIMVNQQKQNALETTNTIITKHERAIQHQAEPMMAMNNANNTNNVTVVTTSKDYASVNNDNNNCTRINIITNNSNNSNAATANNQIRQVVSAFNSPEKKSAAFHEMLISELAAMRTRSCSMENLQTTKQFLQQQPPQSPQSVKESIIDKEFQNYKQFKALENQLKANNSNNINQTQQDQQQQQLQQQKSITTTPPLSNNKHHNHHQHHHPQTPDDDIDADNIEDADGDVEEDLKKSLKVIAAQNTPRKRTPSGCSSDSSPYGTERSARIRTSDWIEVGDNGKQVTLTSCHISLEDSGLEDEERMDEMSSSGVGDSWDSVKEAEQQQQQQLQLQQQQQQAKRNRNVKRIMSINDLPPLPKSLSGINKMLASDSGLVSDVDTEIKNTKNNDFKQYENQKENNNNLNINHNNNNNINNNNSLKDASDKFNNASLTTQTTNTTLATTSTLSTTTTTTTPLKEINGNETISEIPPAIPGSKLDTQIATLRKEMFGLRQLDLSLLSQLWALNDSIQEFRTMIQEQEQDDDETYSTHSRSPSPYDSVSSDAEDEILTLKSKNRMELQNGNVITTQPKLTTKTYATDNDLINHITTNTTSTNSSSASSSSTSSATVTPSTISATVAEQQQQQQKSQLMKPPLPKPLDVKPVPRMRSAPPPPPTHRKSQTAPPRPT